MFEQGEEGKSWYIILRGSVDVVIHGKGTVTVLQEGDDFGKLALINDSPRYILWLWYFVTKIYFAELNLMILLFLGRPL